LGETGNVLQIDVKNYRANSHGIDRVAFLIRTNPGQDPAPLKQIASGGEISRIALAIKTVLAQVDRVGCLIFDEIDAGIGGNIAEVIGTKFRKVAEDRQIVCVTHLPQIAGKAHRNFRVTKTVSGQETLSCVEKLEGEERVTEIARMLGNDKSEDSRAFARRLLAE
jgi:DNA repair protein RecN (Recombination protein N)